MRSVLFVCALLLAGCAHPWDVAHTALEVTAEAVAQSDRMVATAAGPAAVEAREAVVEEARQASQDYLICIGNAERDPAECGERPYIGDYMDMLAERLEPWDQAAQAIIVMGDVLLLAESAVTAWRDMKDQPENWGTLCARLGEAQEAIVHALEACGVEVPGIWQGALGALEPVCTFIAPQPIEEEEDGQ